MKWIQVMVLTLAMSFAFASQAEPVQAQGIEVGIKAIAATRSGDSFDARLNPLKRQLKHPAFGAYSSFELLKEYSVSLNPKQTKSISLPGGSNASLTYLGQAGSLFKVGLKVGGKINTTQRMARGSTVFQAGIRYKDGILILAIIVK